MSIILPVWNGERFLAQAIESVLGQTFDSFELLVVDDGSTDRSRDIARDFARRDRRMVLLDREHSGIVGALNAGLRAARGEYIARMDADDVASPRRLEKQIAFLDAHADCVAVGSDLTVIDEDGGAVGVIRFPATHAEIVAAMLDGSLVTVAHPTIVMRREAVLAAGGYSASGFPSEDLDLWLRLIELGRLANVGEPLLSYRRHARAVGVVERARQEANSTAMINEARERRGLRRLKPRAASHSIHDNAYATYHFDCARIALSSGRRGTALRHALASIRHAPRWSVPYVILAVCALPGRALALLRKVYERLRSVPRRPSTSAAI